MTAWSPPDKRRRDRGTPPLSILAMALAVPLLAGCGVAGEVLDAQRAVEAEIDAVRSVKFGDAIVEMCERAPIGEVMTRVARDPDFAERDGADLWLECGGVGWGVGVVPSVSTNLWDRG